MRTVDSISRPVFDASTLIAPNRVVVALDGARQTLHFDSATPPANQRRIVLAPGPGKPARAVDGGAYRVYRLAVTADRQTWHSETVMFRASKKGSGGARSPAEGEMEPDWEESDLTALVGAVVVYLGEESELASDVYAVDWLDLPLAATLPAGRIVSFRGRVRNASAAGGSDPRPRAAYRWPGRLEASASCEASPAGHGDPGPVDRLDGGASGTARDRRAQPLPGHAAAGRGRAL